MIASTNCPPLTVDNNYSPKGDENDGVVVLSALFIVDNNYSPKGDENLSYALLATLSLIR